MCDCHPKYVKETYYENGNKITERICLKCKTNEIIEENGICEEKITDFVIPIGRYKGKTIMDVYKKDLSYLRWALNNMDNGIVKDKIKLFMSPYRILWGREDI